MMRINGRCPSQKLWAAVVLCLGSTPAGSDCQCAVLKVRGGWCDACKVGYAASVRIESRMLYETLDNHGHDVDPAAMKCESCRKAVQVDGYCDACRIGFVRKQAYFSAVTYHLAKGEAKDPSLISCPTCRKNMQDGGWCGTCKVGMLGNVVVKEEKGYEEASQALRRLRIALLHLGECESCAVAMFTNGMCPHCRLSYKDGKRVNAPSP